MDTSTDHSPGEVATGSSAAPDGAAGLSRRDRLRMATIEEIKAAARDLLLPPPGGADLSLRAVAREIGMTPSAIYRYFESRQDLIDALARDALESAGAALRVADEADSRASAFARAVTLASAYRRWCLDHRAEFALVFRDGQQTDALRVDTIAFYSVPLQVLSEELRADRIRIPEHTDALPTVRPDVLELAANLAPEGIEPATMIYLVSVWAAVHGFVCLELFGHVPAILEDPEDAFEHHVRLVLRSVLAFDC
ncbi:AcrR family transcriptional regulator [Nocardioides zeae]|uniref:AcrR family transcriptional regulator n=1 Tax=Nocardioides zeae TaxID=1457234 RepID=A0ACC6ID35_9ACTN|nr:TetR/AcrR family transcriptional regulator [Nocardioides zeae]MDR6175726.1 AcrR family transcriptional regulator [Nocardioides zeae]MDR6208655.1 AcrR family transcriptional regulator [Nocardioides zeae]